MVTRVDSFRAGRYDGRVNATEACGTPSIRCPVCNASVIWKASPHRPFCSLSCRLIDLGGWLDERYRIAGEKLAGDPVPDEHVGSGSG